MIDYGVLLLGLKIVKNYLEECSFASTANMHTPEGETLCTDWGYFEEGWNVLEEYAFLMEVKRRTET